MGSVIDESASCRVSGEQDSDLDVDAKARRAHAESALIMIVQGWKISASSAAFPRTDSKRCARFDARIGLQLQLAPKAEWHKASLACARKEHLNDVLYQI